MNNIDQVADLIAKVKTQGIPLSDGAWEVALATVGWPYVFGARGQECTPSYRKTAFNSHGADHPTIKTKCQVLSGTKSTCTGCKWYPGGKKVRCYDCRGFTYWILLQVYGFTLQGAGATSQWNTASNWSAKGTIDTLPKDKLVCLFYTDKNNSKVMAHTGLGYKGETIECSSGVQHSTTTNKKWTHWAIPVCVDSNPQPTPQPTPTPTPTPQPKPDKGYAIVTGKNLALREGPSTDCRVITRAPTGTKVKITELPTDWVYVTYNGKKGFMMRQYLNEG